MMTVTEIFEKTRPWWLERVKISLGNLIGLIPHFEEFLGKIFDTIAKCMPSGNMAEIDRAIQEWAQLVVNAQLPPNQVNWVEVWVKIMETTFQTNQNRLNEAECLALNSALQPVFSHAINQASVVEIKNCTWHLENELLRVRQILERIEDSKSDFISVAAHELRTPLTLIEGYTSMLREAMPTEDTRRLQAALCLKGINSGTKRLRDIVDDMIDVSMIDNNLLSLNFQPIWLNRIFDSVKREFQDILVERKLDFKIYPFNGSSEMIFGDGERLFQAFHNLIANAIKYTPDGGSISVDGRSLPGFLEIVVADTGIGIDPEQHNKIFEKFGRLGNVSLHSSGKTKFKGGGPGLGLPITKGIIEAHGGAIWVESDGHDEIKCPGSKFHVMLPMRKSPPNDRTSHFFSQH